jgi:hypothetical protein
MTVRLLVALGVILHCACASHERPTKAAPIAKTSTELETPEKPTPEEPTPEEPTPEVKRVARASIASVQMIEDCPDAPANEAPASAPQAAPPAAPAPGAAMRPQRKRAPGAVAEDAEYGWSPPHMCTQSSMQIAFTEQGDLPARVVIERITLVDPKKDASLDSVEARRPRAWTDDGSYEVWDEVIAPGTDVRASYSLSVPDWSKVERAIGSASYGHMFVLEVELTIDGEHQTVRSPEFPREQPHVIVT